MIVLYNLKSLGYDVEVKENNIRLSYKGEGRPDKNKVLPLLEELKANKNKVIKELQKGKDILRPIPDETLQDIYLEAMNNINDSYIEGTIKYIQGHHKELDTKIDEVDGHINEIWEFCLQGEASLNDFNATLASYKSLYMQGIDLFKEHLTTEDGNNKDENETLCRRCGKPGERYCYGETKSGEYKFGDFCLECRPY